MYYSGLVRNFVLTLSKRHLSFSGLSCGSTVSVTPLPSRFNQGMFNNAVASNKLIANYLRLGDIASALRVFDNMTVKSTVTWNSILAGYAKNLGNFEVVRQVFDKIPEPNSVPYNIILACCLNNFGIHSARAYFDVMPVKDTASWNTMISGYAQIGLMGEARMMFLAMPEKNTIS